MAAELHLIIHDIRSAHNVGSLFRTADALGVSKIFLTGYTPTPTDRFGRKDQKIAKVSLGAEETVVWEKREIHELIQELKKEGMQVVALEQAKGATLLDSYTPKGGTALIVGNEVEGVPEDVLEAADQVVEIPMLGSKESLNVSVAAGIALYALSR